MQTTPAVTNAAEDRIPPCGQGFRDSARMQERLASDMQALLQRIDRLALVAPPPPLPHTGPFNGWFMVGVFLGALIGIITSYGVFNMAP